MNYILSAVLGNMAVVCYEDENGDIVKHEVEHHSKSEGYVSFPVETGDDERVRWIPRERVYYIETDQKTVRRPGTT